MKVNFFYCYDSKLKQHLNHDGHKYVSYGLHPKTHRQFWQFIQSEELSKSIIEFKK